VPNTHVVTPASLKRAETTSAIGAGVLGAGIGLLLSDLLAAYAVPILVIGLVMHAWGMYDKHRLEVRADVPQPWWAPVLYWICWAALAALLVAVLIQRF
jgi:hypothetical protein